jgi:hypothetical protein
MNHKERTQTLEFIRPKAIFVLRGDELEWLDKHQSEPTEAEIEAGWLAYQKDQEDKAEAKATAKAELLERLGITADEAKLLLA